MLWWLITLGTCQRVCLMWDDESHQAFNCPFIWSWWLFRSSYFGSKDFRHVGTIKDVRGYIRNLMRHSFSPVALTMRLKEVDFIWQPLPHHIIQSILKSIFTTMKKMWAESHITFSFCTRNWSKCSYSNHIAHYYTVEEHKNWAAGRVLLVLLTGGSFSALILRRMALDLVHIPSVVIVMVGPKAFASISPA